MSHDKHLRCSFCGKSKDSVRKFISGPSVYICNECIALCNEILAEGDALVADVDRRTGNELPDRVLRLAAEGAAQVLIVGHRALVWETAGARARRHFFLPSSISL